MRVLILISCPALEVTETLPRRRRPLILPASEWQPDTAQPPLGRAEGASQRINEAVRFILAHHGHPRLSIIAHTWGSMPARRFDGEHSELVDRINLLHRFVVCTGVGIRQVIASSIDSPTYLQAVACSGDGY